MSEGLYIFGLVGAVCGGVCGVVLVLEDLFVYNDYYSFCQHIDNYYSISLS